MDNNGITDEIVRIRNTKESRTCLNKISLIVQRPGDRGEFEGLDHHPRFGAKAGYWVREKIYIAACLVHMLYEKQGADRR